MFGMFKENKRNTNALFFITRGVKGRKCSAFADHKRNTFLLLTDGQNKSCVEFSKKISHAWNFLS